jgi:predicted methyltransferase
MKVTYFYPFHSNASTLTIAFALLVCSLISLPVVAETNLYLAAIDHPNRPQADREKDKTRKPELILPFTQIKQGDKVLELGAGSGHTTELLARVVGASGVVYAQGLTGNRVRRSQLTNVVSLRRHLLFELPEVLKENDVPAGSLDAVVLFFTLHDFYLSSRIDKEEVLANLHIWLKDNGSLIILDNAADADAGNSVNHRLHRIGENFIISELDKAGFKVDSTSNALRNPEDDHSKSWQLFNGLHDRFAIRFVKK